MAGIDGPIDEQLQVQSDEQRITDLIRVLRNTEHHWIHKVFPNGCEVKYNKMREELYKNREGWL